MSYQTAVQGMQERLHVNQGEHRIGVSEGVCLTAVLGSCVAICLHDPVARIGGMNHFLLPDSANAGADSGGRYGAFLAELLINDLMQKGAIKSRLEAKIFGGGKMFTGMRDVGAANAAFAQNFLDDEGIRVVGSSLGGTSARRVDFWPATGKAFQKRVNRAPEPLPPPPPPADTMGDVELFCCPTAMLGPS